MARAKDRKSEDGWMLPQYAAVALEVTRPTVLARIARKELRSKTTGGVLFVWREDVEREAAKRAA